MKEHLLRLPLEAAIVEKLRPDVHFFRPEIARADPSFRRIVPFLSLRLGAFSWGLADGFRIARI
jgi:hypothetical protein